MSQIQKYEAVVRQGLAADNLDTRYLLILADAYLSTNDPKGELIMLDHAIREHEILKGDCEDPKEKNKLKKLYEEFDERKEKFERQYAIKNSNWRYGLITGVDCNKYDEDTLTKIFSENPFVSVLMLLGPGDSDIIALFSNFNYLSNLTHLEFGSSRLRNRELVKSLADCKYLEGLTYLNLSFNDIGPYMDSFADSKYLRNLETLYLKDCAIDAEGLVAFAASKSFGKLTHLDLTGCGIVNLFMLEDPQGVDYLAGSYDDSGLKALADSPNSRNLVWLNLSANHIGPEGPAILTTSKYLTNLEYLILNGNPIHAEGLVSLAASDYFEKLTYLNLCGCKVVTGENNDYNDDGLIALANFNTLKDLNLSGNSIGDAGMTTLADIPNLESLNFLKLCFNQITDAGAEVLAASPNLGNLTYLDLSFNDIGSKGKKCLAESEHLKGAKIIY